MSYYAAHLIPDQANTSLDTVDTKLEVADMANTTVSKLNLDGIPSSSDFASLVMAQVNKIDSEQMIVNDALTNPHSRSAAGLVQLQNTLQQFTIDTNVAGKVVSILTKDIDGLVHTQ